MKSIQIVHIIFKTYADMWDVFRILVAVFSGSCSGGSCCCSSGSLSGSCAGALPNAAVGLCLGGLGEAVSLASCSWVSVLGIFSRWMTASLLCTAGGFLRPEGTCHAAGCSSGSC